MKYLFLFTIPLLFFTNQSHAASCRQMKEYHRFTDEMCRQVTSVAEGLKEDVDARLKAAEQVTKLKKHEIYSGQNNYLQGLTKNKSAVKDSEDDLKINCAKLTRQYVLSHVEQASKKQNTRDQLISYFDMNLLDKLKSTGTTNEKCIAAVFKLVDAHNFVVQENIKKNQDVDRLKCIHQQNCGADGLPRRKQ